MSQSQEGRQNTDEDVNMDTRNTKEKSIEDDCQEPSMPINNGTLGDYHQSQPVEVGGMSPLVATK